jgi:hypothetical protein
MGLASDRTVYSSKRNRPLLLYGRLLDDSRPSHGLTATNPDYFLFAVNPGVNDEMQDHHEAATHRSRSTLRAKTYWQRKARTGSTRVARSAGMKDADSATIVRRTATAA